MSDAEMLAGEIPGATLVRAAHPLEWRLRPERLDAVTVDLTTRCWDVRPGRESARRRARRAGA
jgi:hypothetical protein